LPVLSKASLISIRTGAAFLVETSWSAGLLLISKYVASDCVREKLELD
jgi:hypothetical protein